MKYEVMDLTVAVNQYTYDNDNDYSNPYDESNYNRN